MMSTTMNSSTNATNSTKSDGQQRQADTTSKPNPKMSEAMATTIESKSPKPISKSKSKSPSTTPNKPKLQSKAKSKSSPSSSPSSKKSKLSPNRKPQPITPPTSSSLSLSPLSTKQQQKNSPQQCTHALYNLTLLDPPKYGWCASGPIINILEPHHSSHRKSSQQTFLQNQKLIYIQNRRKRQREAAAAKRKRELLLIEQQKKQNEKVSSAIVAEKREEGLLLEEKRLPHELKSKSEEEKRKKQKVNQVDIDDNHNNSVTGIGTATATNDTVKDEIDSNRSRKENDNPNNHESSKTTNEKEDAQVLLHVVPDVINKETTPTKGNEKDDETKKVNVQELSLQDQSEKKKDDDNNNNDDDDKPTTKSNAVTAATTKENDDNVHTVTTSDTTVTPGTDTVATRTDNPSDNFSTTTTTTKATDTGSTVPANDVNVSITSGVTAKATTSLTSSTSTTAAAAPPPPIGTTTAIADVAIETAKIMMTLGIFETEMSTTTTAAVSTTTTDTNSTVTTSTTNNGIDTAMSVSTISRATKPSTSNNNNKLTSSSSSIDLKFVSTPAPLVNLEETAAIAAMVPPPPPTTTDDTTDVDVTSTTTNTTSTKVSVAATNDDTSTCDKNTDTAQKMDIDTTNQQQEDSNNVSNATNNETKKDGNLVSTITAGVTTVATTAIDTSKSSIKGGMANSIKPSAEPPLSLSTTSVAVPNSVSSPKSNNTKPSPKANAAATSAATSVATPLSTSNIKTRNQGQKIPSTKGVKRKKRKVVETLEFCALIIDNDNKKENDKQQEQQQVDVDIKKEGKDLSIGPSSGGEDTKVNNAVVEKSQDKTESKESSENEQTDSNDQSTNATSSTSQNSKSLEENNTKKIKLDPFVYHRGRDGEEPRNKHTGELLCPIQATDTNHEWDEPNLKFKVKVCFPLVDTDELFMSDDENDGKQKDGNIGNAMDTSDDFFGVDGVLSSIGGEGNAASGGPPLPVQPVRRYAKRSRQNKNTKKFESMRLKRLKREAKIKALPHFEDNIDWDLSDPTLRTPLVYASDIAGEYGLSLNQMLDLARSIQEQIDDYVRSNINYKIPISTIDPYSAPRSELLPPEIKFPKILYGGHGATNIVPRKNSLSKVSDDDDDDDAETSEVESVKEVPSAKKINKSSSGRTRHKPSANRSTSRNRSSTGGSSTASGSRGGRKHTGSKPISNAKRSIAAVPKDELRKHDTASFSVRQEYVEELLLRLSKETKQNIAAMNGQTGEEGQILGKPYLRRNHNCHICHIRKPECLVFPCGNERHTYCDYHCAQRLGFKIKDYKTENIDYCPVCQLSCLCSKCHKDVGVAASRFKAKCDAQKLGVKDVVIESIMDMKSCQKESTATTKSHKAKSKSRVDKRSKPVKNTTQSKAKRQKVEKPEVPLADPTTDRPENIIIKHVKKVPREEFPSEMCDGVNYDPSLEDDYLTIFTPQGSRLSSIPPLKVEDSISATSVEDTKLHSAEELVEDGNVEYCQMCRKTGGLICCDYCPRAFHEKCLNVKKSDLPEKWECPKCTEDGELQEEGEKITESTYFQKLIHMYTSLEQDETIPKVFWQKLNIVSIAVDIIDRLIEYDFGSVFELPVNVKEVPDYRKTIKNPMDLGTIKNNILKGNYMKKLHHVKKNNECTKMEQIALEVLKDFELVWHNCLLYNRDGSSYHRMGKVMSKKYHVMRGANLDQHLTEYIKQELGMYIVECKQLRRDAASNTAKNNLNKPWIPPSKRKIKAPSIRRGVKRTVAVFDPCTSMIIKQYTSMNAAGLAAIALGRAGFDAELESISINSVKSTIHKSASDPSVLLFGYRWMFLEDIRSGSFIASANNLKDASIRKICTISGVTLAEFTSVESAHKDWLEFKKSRVTLQIEGDGKDSIEFFQEQFLDGKEDLDGITWKKFSIENKGENGKVKMEKGPTEKDEEKSTLEVVGVKTK